MLAKKLDPYPPNITDYLNAIQSKVGTATTWQEMNIDVYSHFNATGNWMWMSKLYLEKVINSGIRMFLFRLCHSISVTRGAFKMGDAVTGAVTKFRHCT